MVKVKESFSFSFFFFLGWFPMFSSWHVQFIIALKTNV